MSRTIAPPQDIRLILLIATRKGEWLHHSDAKRKTRKADGPHFLGHTIAHLELDPRDGRFLLATAERRSPQGLYRSEDRAVN